MNSEPMDSSSSGRDRRLEQVLIECVEALEKGQPLDRQELLARYPEFAAELAEFFAGRDRIEQLAEPLRALAPKSHPKTNAGLDAATIGHTECSPADSQVGSTVHYFGDYELLEEIARGGMGVVYKAKQVSLNRIVALKMILAGQFASAVEVQRFHSEAEAAANLDHPNIVPIYEVGEHEGRHYFSMKLIVRGSEAKNQGGDQRQAARLVEAAARAVHYAHQRGIIHRDLKPANILVDEQGQPHITDFGLAKRMEGDTNLSQSGAIVGTPAYMAPEQAAGKKGLTTSADVYSLGAILYELLAGQPPFVGSTPMEILLQVMDKEPTPPRQVQPGIDRDLETICLKCLAKDPQKRYGAAEALAEDLLRFQAGEPILARPARTPERLWRWCKRKPALAAAGSAALLAGLLALVTFAGAFILVRQSRDEAVELANEKELQRLKAVELAAANEILATNAVQDKRDIAERHKKAETLVVELKFEQAFQQPEENRALSMLSAAALLRDAVALENRPLQDSLRLHLGNWFQGVHRVKCVLAHTNSVHASAFSPDGKLVLTGSGDTTARLWETATGKPVGPPLQHQGRVNVVAFSPDGKTVLTGSSDHTARLWETATSKQIGRPLQHQREVLAVSYSPNGKAILTGSWDGTARLWEAVTGKQIGPPLQHQAEVRAAVFSPDGKTVLTGSQDKTARLWETATGNPFGPPLQHPYEVRAAAFSPDGKTVLTGSADNKARLWEAVTGKQVGQPWQHQHSVEAVAFSPDGKTVLTGSYDGTARLWETATGKQIGPPLQHQDQVVAVAFSPDGTTMLTGSRDRTARLWETATGKPAGQPLLHQEMVLHVAFSPDGKTMLTGSASRDMPGLLWEAATGKPFAQPLKHNNWVNAGAFSPDSKTVLTGSSDETARLWDAATGKQVGPPLQHQHGDPDSGKHGVGAVAFSRDGNTALTGSADKTARLWETATGKQIGPPLQHQTEVGPVAFSPDGNSVLTGSRDGTAQLWERASAKPLGRPMHHQGWIAALAFSPDGKTVLTGSSDHTARLWETATSKQIGQSLQHQGEVIAVAFSPDGKTVLTGSWDGTARLWETATGKQLGPTLQHQAAVRSVVISPDGKTVLTASDDKTAQLWQRATGKRLGPPLQHQAVVRAAVFSPDGNSVLTGSDDNTARLWETATGKSLGLLLQHQGYGKVLAVAFSPNGNTVITGGYMMARLWHVPLPIQGDPERVLLWTQVLTGMELDEYGQVRLLDAKTWQERRQQLEKLGGPLAK